MAVKKRSDVVMCTLSGHAVADAPFKVRWNTPCPRPATLRTSAGQALCTECMRYQLQKAEASRNVATARIRTLRKSKPLARAAGDGGANVEG